LSPSPAKEDPSARFDEFWAAYPPSPRKTDRPKARALFASIVAGKHKTIPKTDPAVIIAACRAYAEQVAPEFVKMPTGWLNGARWETFAQPDAAEASNFRAMAVEWLRAYHRAAMALAAEKAANPGDKRALDREAVRQRDQARAMADAEGWSSEERRALDAEARALAQADLDGRRAA